VVLMPKSFGIEVSKHVDNTYRYFAYIFDEFAFLLSRLEKSTS
jgi:hypothetical protein